MSAIAPPPYDLIGEELRGFYQAEGRELWRNRSRLTGLLLDHQPELRREIRAVASAIEQGVARALGETERNLAALAIDRQANLMETEVGLRPEVARNVTRAIAHALDLGPLPSVYHDAPSSSPVSPPHSGQRSIPAHQPMPATFAPASARQPQMPHMSGPARRFPWPVTIVGGALALAAAIVIAPGISDTGISDAPGANPTNGVSRGYGDELADYGVPAQATLRENMNGATPLQIAGATRVTTDELRTLIAKTPNLLLIDVLAGAHAQTLANANYVPVAGLAGTLTDGNQTTLGNILSRLTGGDIARPLAFFCMGASCWESYNAALRAGALGYTDIRWYRGGLQAWEQAQLPMNALPPAAPGG